MKAHHISCAYINISRSEKKKGLEITGKGVRYISDKAIESCLLTFSTALAVENVKRKMENVVLSFIHAKFKMIM